MQCTSNGLTVFPSYYKVARCNDYVQVTPEVSITVIGADVGTYSKYVMGSYLCLTIRNDPRYTYTVTNVGNWSPDSYN